MDHSFSNQEKRFILAEMLKASQIEVDAVVEFIQSRHIMPNWMEMELPRGRNMNQCLQAVNNMGISTPPPALSQHHSQFRQYGSQPSAQQLAQLPLQHQVQHQQPHLQQHMPQQHRHPQQHQQQQRADESSLHLSRQAPLAPKRRPSTDSGEHPSKRAATASAETMHPVSQPRILQPRPTHSPLPSSPSLMPTAPPAGRPAPKKRGRPSRAEKDAQARAAGNYPLAFIAPASNIIPQNESPRSMYQPISTRVTPEGPVSSTDYWDHQGMRRSTDSSPQPVREPFSVPSEIPAESAKPEPVQIDRPTSQESVAEPTKTPKPSPPTAPGPQPSSRLAVADLLKSTGSSTITTGV